MECVNLKQRFGTRYRVRYEESYQAQHGQRGRVEDPWLQIIPCALGHVFPWGGSRLAASTNTSGPTATKLKRLPFVQIAQDGTDGVTVVFDVEHFPMVAEIMQPRRRRQVQLTDAQRAEIGQRLAQARKGGAQAMVQSDPEGLVCVPMAPVG